MYGGACPGQHMPTNVSLAFLSHAETLIPWPCGSKP